MKGEPQEISETVATWLHCQSLTGLRDLLSEACMTLPIAEYLSSKYGHEIESEKQHPVFKNSKPGRPRQLDFVRLKHGKKTWHAAYETKYKTESFEAIVYDLCRFLRLSHASELGNPKRFFIFASEVKGKQKILTNAFSTGEGGKRQPYFSGILPFSKSGEPSTFALNKLHSKLRRAFKKYSKEYGKPVPSSVKITLDGRFHPYTKTCAVWQVRAQKGSIQLSHTEIAP